MESYIYIFSKSEHGVIIKECVNFQQLITVLKKKKAPVVCITGVRFLILI